MTFFFFYLFFAFQLAFSFIVKGLTKKKKKRIDRIDWIDWIDWKKKKNKPQKDLNKEKTLLFLIINVFQIPKI